MCSPLYKMNRKYIWNVIQSTFPFKTSEFFLLLGVLFFLYVTSIISYNFFYVLNQLFCIIIAFGIFIVSWNAKKFFSNHFLLFISIGYFFVSAIDLAHLLVFNGLGYLPLVGSTSNIESQLWIAARFFQASFLIVAPIYLTRKMKIVFINEIFSLIVLLIIVSIFYLKIFPTTYIDGLGATMFYKFSEYVISLILVGSAIFLIIKRKYLDKHLFNYLMTSIFFSIASEMSFTPFFSSFAQSNLLGHLFKLISFSMIYKVAVQTGVSNPLSYIFKNLEDSNKAISESEMKFKSLVYIAPSAVILTDNMGKISLWNQSAEDIFGWTKEETLGNLIDIICPNEKHKSNKNSIKEIISDRNPQNFKMSVESFGLRKNGEIFPLDISSSSYKVNNIDYFSYIIRDISKNVKAKKELLARKIRLENVVKDLSIFKLALDNAFAHIFITDNEGVIVYANKSSEEITGYSKKEIIGKSPALWGGQMSQEYYSNFWKTIKIDKQNFSDELTNRRKNGQFYPAEIRVSPVLNNNKEIEFFVCLERDISEAKAIEMAKTEFISLAAHQLKTPLTTISLASELLMKDVSKDISSENKKYLNAIFSEIKEMTKLIEIFLNVSRVEMGKFPIETKKISLSELLDKTVRKTMPLLRDKQIKFKKVYNKNLPVMNLDKKVINIILENLISNAIKYSTDNGEIALIAKKEKDNINIAVSDSGIGIPEHQQSQIFTKMFRAENVNKIKSEGSGLGLYLVKNLARQSGYVVSFKSKEKEGSTFSLSIPINKNSIDRKLVDISNS